MPLNLKESQRHDRPHTGARIETFIAFFLLSFVLIAPTRGRGLKLLTGPHRWPRLDRPHTGARIETPSIQQRYIKRQDRPHTGARIETSGFHLSFK